MNQHSSPWTAELCDRLRELRAAGWSFGRIGAAIGLSRNALVGKAHRMGLPKTEAQPRERKPRKSRARAAVRRVSVPRPLSSDVVNLPPDEFDAAIPASQRASIADLEFKDGRPTCCRYLLGDGRYCGGAIFGESSYCAHHWLRCHEVRR